jgi:hypothetical protein
VEKTNKDFIETFEYDEPDIMESETTHIEERERTRGKLVAKWLSEFNVEYLQGLGIFHTEKSGPTRLVSLGKVYLVKQVLASRMSWKMAQVLKLISGKDTIVRKVELRMVDAADKLIKVNRAVTTDRYERYRARTFTH